MQNFTKRKAAGSLKKTGLVLLFLLGLSVFSLAQVRTVTGIVSTSDTKETLPGATIQIKGTDKGVVTDIDGKYRIEVQKDADILIFSFMGYEPQEITVGNRTVIDVVLNPSRISLDEVVVIGYGTVKKSDLTGSVGSVKSEDLTKITALDPVQSLQGKVTGVYVSSPSGTPGAIPVVRIRGIGTFNNTSPIYVVDGVILDDISYLNSNDIASIEVLKDASASAIYGSRGANGVILVTTKSGNTKLTKTQFNIYGEYGIQNVAKKISLLNGRDFAIISNEIKPGSFNNVDVVPNTDWQDLIFRIAPVYNFQLSASGASKSIQYYISAGYFSQDGIIEKSSFQRITIQLNNIYNLTGFLKFGNNITLTPYKQRIAPNVTYQAYRAEPVIEPYDSLGNFAEVKGVGNPLADLAYSNNFVSGIRGVGNVYGELTFLKDFVLKSSFGIDASYIKGESFSPIFNVSPAQQNLYRRLNKSQADRLTWLWENTLTYTKDFKKHHIDALIGYTMQNTASEDIYIPGSNIIRDARSLWYLNSNYLTDPNNLIGNFRDVVDPNAYYSMISLLFRANYTFNKRYIVTFTFRRDGSSKFSKENRYSNFPSVAAGWNISQENFMKKQKVISRLKLRGSWGQMGNEKIAYSDRYSVVDLSLVSVFGSPSTIYPAATYGLTGNPDLKWEKTTQTDVGLEVGLLNDRLTGEFDFYNRKTEDILVALATPGYLGNGVGQRVTFNAGSVLNRGFEFNIGWKEKVKDFKYSITFLGSTIHNEVLSIGGNSGVDSVLFGGYLANGQFVTRSSVGFPIGAFYGYQTDGIFQTQEELNSYPHMSQAGVGDLRFVDINGDGKIDGRDRTYIGSPIPKFIFGFNFTLEWKGIDFSIDIQGQTGNKIFNAKDCVRPDPYNFETTVLDHWTGPGTSNTEPRPSFGGYNYTPSDHFLQDGSYLRIRNLTLGYTLPSKWTTKIYFEKLRIYFKTDNLFTWTKFTGYSPEIGSSDVLSNGIDAGIYPITAVYALGINITL